MAHPIAHPIAHLVELLLDNQGFDPNNAIFSSALAIV